jgi:hypothetical protein
MPVPMEEPTTSNAYIYNPKLNKLNSIQIYRELMGAESNSIGLSKEMYVRTLS